MKRSLTIITPTLNSEKTLQETLVSLQPLAKAGAKLIVVDSNSTDGTVSIARAQGAKVYTVAPGNMYEAINCGLEKSRTDWYTYINSDDLLYADAVEKALLDFGSTADVIFGSIDLVDGMGRLLHSWNSPPAEDFQKLISNRIMPIPQAGTLFRKEVANALRGFDTTFRFASDFDFFLRASVAGFKFARLKIPRIAAFRLHANQISQRKMREMKDEVDRSIRQNGIKCGTYRYLPAYLMFRFRNWDSYVLRMMRMRHLMGRTGLGSTLSYE